MDIEIAIVFTLYGIRGPELHTTVSARAAPVHAVYPQVFAHLVDRIVIILTEYVTQSREVTPPCQRMEFISELSEPQMECCTLEESAHLEGAARYSLSDARIFWWNI